MKKFLDAFFLFLFVMLFIIVALYLTDLVHSLFASKYSDDRTDCIITIGSLFAVVYLLYKGLQIGEKLVKHNRKKTIVKE